MPLSTHKQVGPLVNHGQKTQQKPKWRSSKNADEPVAQSPVIFEFVQAGNAMRVSAIDEASGVEVTLVAPLTATQFEMERIALAKLKRRLAQLS